jgi:hypothetical protein
MPPAAAGAEPMPAEGASPEGAMQAMEQERMAQLQAVAAAAPVPESPYSTALLVKMVEQINAIADIVDETMADIEYVPEGAKHDGPLPPEIFVPLFLILSLVAGLEDEAVREKYMMDPATLTNDAAIRKATGLLSMMAKDDAVISVMQEIPTEGVEEEPPEEPLPDEAAAGAPVGEFDETDEDIMAEM